MSNTNMMCTAAVFPHLLTALLAGVLLAGCTANTPAPIRSSTATPAGTVQTQPAQVRGAREHVVQPGDTLMGIGRLYGQHPSDLARWNGLSNPHQINVGQRLVVAPPGSTGGGSMGSSVEPVAVAQPVQVIPVAPDVSPVTPVPVKQTPQGGKQPYNDQAWAAVRPGAMSPPPTPVPTTPPATTATTAPKSSAWIWPASGRLIAGFNEASNKGVDIGGNPGDPVVASAGGKVVYSGSGLRGYGKLVIIKHDENYLTAYAHNRELLVKEGDSVTQGQKIAELGSTDADKPKLHFEIRRQGRPVDPMSYLPPR
ncbi:MAG: peptidoglycan DD-metalloendopeptidase family protein [Rhodocyclaceae bacterium]